MELFLVEFQRGTRLYHGIYPTLTMALLRANTERLAWPTGGDDAGTFKVFRVNLEAPLRCAERCDSKRDVILKAEAKSKEVK